VIGCLGSQVRRFVNTDGVLTSGESGAINRKAIGFSRHGRRLLSESEEVSPDLGVLLQGPPDTQQGDRWHASELR